MHKLKFYFIVVLFIMTACAKEEKPLETCMDKIKNQNEQDVDCGGICKPCPASMSAEINGSYWKADVITASFVAGSSSLTIKGNPESPIYPLIQIIYTGPLQAGTFPLSSSTSYVPGISAFVIFTSGSITFNTVDKREGLLSGSFSFICKDNVTAENYTITRGILENIQF